MERCVMILEVVGGILPGQPEREYTKRWVYTSKMKEEDLARPVGARNHFLALEAQAEQYARELRNPAFLNWVRVDWIWL